MPAPGPLESQPPQPHPREPHRRRTPQAAATSTDGVRVRIPDTDGHPADSACDNACVDAVAIAEPDHTPQPATPAPSPVPAMTRGRASGPRAGDDIDPAARTPRSFHLSRQLLERARAAAYWVNQLGGAGEATNVSELVERALRREVERLEAEYNDSQPFPAVQGRMRSGPGAAGVERIRRAQRLRRR